MLGHVQRGGTPVPADRVLATEFGNAAINLLMSGAKGRLVVMKGRTVTDIALTEVANKQRLVPKDHPLILAARNVGTCFGDGGNGRLGLRRDVADQPEAKSQAG